MMIFLIVVGILLFLLFMPLTVQLSYQGELTVWAGVFFPFIRVFSTQKSGKKKKKQKIKKEEKQQKKQSIDKHMLWIIVKQIPRQIKRLISVQSLVLNIQIGNDDPADLAMLYGAANAIVDSAAAVLSPIYPREKWHVEIVPDFDLRDAKIEGKVCAHTNLWRIIYVLISLLSCGILLLYNTADEQGEGVQNHG